MVAEVSECAIHNYLNFVARAINRHPEVRDDFLSGLSREVDGAAWPIRAEGQDNLQGLHAQVVALNFYLIRRVNGLPLPAAERDLSDPRRSADGTWTRLKILLYLALVRPFQVNRGRRLSSAVHSGP